MARRQQSYPGKTTFIGRPEHEMRLVGGDMLEYTPLEGVPDPRPIRQCVHVRPRASCMYEMCRLTAMKMRLYRQQERFYRQGVLRGDQTWALREMSGTPHQS